MEFVTGLQTAAGVSTFLGLVSLFGYLYYSYQVQQAAKSIRGLLEGERHFTAKDVVALVERFKSDDSRLKALEILTNYSRGNSKELLGRVKARIDVDELTKISPNKSRFVSLTMAVLFFALAISAIAYYRLIPSEGGGAVGVRTPASAPASPPDAASVPRLAPIYAFRWRSTSPAGLPLTFIHTETTQNRHGRSDIIASGTVGFPPELQGPPEKRLVEVTYGCIGDRCGWSYNPDGGNRGKTTIAPNGQTFTWSRKWDGDPTPETYTARYEIAEQYCTANCP